MQFDAKVEKLDDVTAFVEESLDDHGVTIKQKLSILVAVEELFVNVASYAYGDGEGTAEVIVDYDENGVIITIIDSGVEFDPVSKEDPDVDASAEDRPIGGLGIFMVKKSMDDMKYERTDGKNILTIYKKYVS